MEITKYNSVQFSEKKSSDLVGVSLVYSSVNSKTGEIRQSCIHLHGDEFIPQNGTEPELFGIWKKVVALHWESWRVTKVLKEDNNGIQAKLRGGAPEYIVVRGLDGKVKFRWNRPESIFQKVGLIPTKKDLEEGTSKFKKGIHKAAKASWDAMRLKFVFETENEKPKTEGKTEGKVA